MPGEVDVARAIARARSVIRRLRYSVSDDPELESEIGLAVAIEAAKPDDEWFTRRAMCRARQMAWRWAMRRKMRMKRYELGHILDAAPAAMEENKDRRCLIDMVASLSGQARQAADMYYLRGWSPGRVAMELNLSQNDFRCLITNVKRDLQSWSS